MFWIETLTEGILKKYPKHVVGGNKNKTRYFLHIILSIKESLQWQIHFNGNIFGNKCCRCNEGSLKFKPTALGTDKNPRSFEFRNASFRTNSDRISMHKHKITSITHVQHTFQGNQEESNEQLLRYFRAKLFCKDGIPGYYVKRFMLTLLAFVYCV